MSLPFVRPVTAVRNARDSIVKICGSYGFTREPAFSKKRSGHSFHSFPLTERYRCQAFSQWKLARKIKSPLLEVDTKNWLVDGLLSIAVAVAFLIAMLLSGTRFAFLLPYTDSTVVIVLVLLSLPIPAIIIRDNWNQLLGRAPDAALQDRAREAVASAISDASASETRIRMQQLGRLTYVQLYVVLDSEFSGELDDLDRCRHAVSKALAGEFDPLAIDVIFTRDPHWVAASVGNTVTAETERQAKAASSELTADSPSSDSDDAPTSDK